jgi:hypothetical protein
VRILSLTDDDNKNESAFKYRLVDTDSLSSRRLPDVLIIGVKKSGTRALLEFIRLHPDGKNNYFNSNLNKIIVFLFQSELPAMRFTFLIDIMRLDLIGIARKCHQQFQVN